MQNILRLLKNKRLHFVIAALWLITCFFIVRNDAIKTADKLLDIDMKYCYGRADIATHKSCVDEAMASYVDFLKITNEQLSDIFFLFLLPIIVILLLVGVIKWIGNYKY